MIWYILEFSGFLKKEFMLSFTYLWKIKPEIKSETKLNFLPELHWTVHNHLRADGVEKVLVFHDDQTSSKVFLI